jgi:hypothetical protein
VTRPARTRTRIRTNLTAWLRRPLSGRATAQPEGGRDPWTDHFGWDGPGQQDSTTHGLHAVNDPLEVETPEPGDTDLERAHGLLHPAPPAWLWHGADSVTVLTHNDAVRVLAAALADGASPQCTSRALHLRPYDSTAWWSSARLTALPHPRLTVTAHSGWWRVEATDLAPDAAQQLLSAWWERQDAEPNPDAPDHIDACPPGWYDASRDGLIFEINPDKHYVLGAGICIHDGPVALVTLQVTARASDEAVALAHAFLAATDVEPPFGGLAVVDSAGDQSELSEP